MSKSDGIYLTLEKEFSSKSFERQDMEADPAYICEKQADESSYHEIADVQNNYIEFKEIDEECYADKYGKATKTCNGVLKPPENLAHESVFKQEKATNYSKINELDREDASPGNMNDVHFAQNDKLHHDSSGDYDTLFHTKQFKTINRTDYGVIQDIAGEYDRLNTVTKPDTAYVTLLSSERKPL